jgi:protein gp37
VQNACENRKRMKFAQSFCVVRLIRYVCGAISQVPDMQNRLDTTPKNAIESKSKMWNLWHGCHKLSAGCQHCYVYRGDSKRGIDSSIVSKTKNFDLPIQKKRDGEYKIPSGSLVYTCFTSDFFVEEADEWRAEAWEMIRLRSDLRFMMITKRIDRLQVSLPDDWSDGYENVTICCTVETQDRADYRLPIY